MNNKLRIGCGYSLLGIGIMSCLGAFYIGESCKPTLTDYRPDFPVVTKGLYCPDMPYKPGVEIDFVNGLPVRIQGSWLRISKAGERYVDMFMDVGKSPWPED